MTGGHCAHRGPDRLSPVWTLHRTSPGAVVQAPAGREDLEALARMADAVLPAAVPGTAASAWRDALEAGADLPPLTPVEAVRDDRDWWWSAVLRVEEPTAVRVHAPGIATSSVLHVDGREVSSADSAFQAHVAEVELSRGDHVVSLVCRSLTGLPHPSRPRARWRSGLVPDRSLRWHRTPLIGRIPWAGTAPVIGPWAGLALDVRTEDEVRILSARTRLRPDGEGVVDVVVAARSAVELTVGCGGARRELRVEPGTARIELTVPGPELWWPAAHGTPALHELEVSVDGRVRDSRRVGFRTVEVERDAGSFRLRINGRAVFARGAVWSPVDPLALGGSAAEIDETVRTLVAAGANLLRVPGTDAYADPALLEACDRHGAMLWQDTPLASVDPPEEPGWLDQLAQETETWARRLGQHPCLAVWSGGTENLQQAVLSGRGPQSWTSSALETVIPQAVEAGARGLVCVANSPSGGRPPTRIDTGLSHYFGVGAYRRPLSDAVTSGVRFAAECLAFGCPPDEASVIADFGAPGADADEESLRRWRADGARDPGAVWSFEEIAEHYAREMFGPVPARGVPGQSESRAASPDPSPWHDRAERLEAERRAVEHVMTEVLARWRGRDSRCDGAVVLASRDLTPGPGWGLLDSRGRPKAGLRGFAAACAPTAVVILDHGLDGPHVHVFHDGPEPLRARARISTTTAQGVPGPRAEAAVDIDGPGELVIPIEPALGGFLDLSGAWGFGAPAYDRVDVELGPATAGPALRATFHRPGTHSITHR